MFERRTRSTERVVHGWQHGGLAALKEKRTDKERQHAQQGETYTMSRP